MSGAFYRELLAPTRTTELMRGDLVDMGRPLWQRYKVRTQETRRADVEWNDLLWFAGSKLLHGLGADIQNFNDHSMCGVASLLCRLRIRPTSSSPFAARAVADFMAVLSHMTCSHDQFVTTYASEPILAFGAARLWYLLVPEPRETRPRTVLNHLERIH